MDMSNLSGFEVAAVLSGLERLPKRRLQRGPLSWLTLALDAHSGLNKLSSFLREEIQLHNGPAFHRGKWKGR